MKKPEFCLAKIIIILIIAFLSFPAAGSGADYVFKKSFEGAELEKVRAWEKEWVGKKIDASNVDAIKEFVLPSYYDIVKDTGRWGNTWFTIVPYETCAYTPGQKKYTQEYYGKTKLGSNNEMVGYVAGYPFPDTDKAIEMAYNFRTRTDGGTLSSTDVGFIVDGRLKYDMDIKLSKIICYYSGRTDLPPTPELPGNAKNIWRAFMVKTSYPPESRNQRIMEIQYKRFTKAYDMWMWLPSIRRIKRRSTTERQDSSSGGDNCGYDNAGWDGPILINTYKYLGPKDELLVRHTDETKLVHDEGHTIWNNMPMERIKVHLVEVQNNDPNFLYSKMIWHMDPETWQILWSDRYDNRGRLWKIGGQLGHIGKGYGGIDVPHFIGNINIDVQRTHGTVGLGSNLKYGVDVDTSLFRPANLQKFGY